MYQNEILQETCDCQVLSEDHQLFLITFKADCKGLAKQASIVCPTSVFGAWSLLFASFAGSQICMAKLASKHRTSNICLPTCKMCLPNMKCLTNLVVAKRASKDRLLKLSHVRQTMLVSFARPLKLDNKKFHKKCVIANISCIY